MEAKEKERPRNIREKKKQKTKNDAQADLGKNKIELLKTLGNLKLKPNGEVKYPIRKN